MFFRLIILFFLLCWLNQSTSTENDLPNTESKIVQQKADVETKITNIIIDNLELSKEVAQQQHKSIIVIFTADWCRYCAILKDQYDLFFASQNKYIVCYINIDNNPMLAKQFNVSMLPTSILLKQTNEEWAEKSRNTGFHNEKYKIWLQKHW